MVSLKNKTVLITGATDGLGKLVAHRAAEAGATLILHGRNEEKGKTITEDIKSATGNNSIFYYNADFSSLPAVKGFAEDVLAHHQQLHVLINNAAIGGGPKGNKQRELS